MTLIELLVVVSILVMLTVFALPVIAPSVEGKRIREAGRGMNVYLGSTRNKAMETGRPHGVIFQRTQNLNQAATTLYQAEVPPPYAGDFVESRIVITSTGTVRFTGGELPTQPVGSSPPLVQAGDLIQLNYQGHIWRIDAISGQQWAFSCTTAPGIAGPPVTPPEGLPFQVFRQPTPTAAAPLQLPSTVVVDLRWSGIGTTDANRAETFRPTSDTDQMPVVVMFSPKGEVDGVYCYNSAGVYARWQAPEPFYFLVGKQQRVPATLGGPSPAEDGLYNWRDTSNLWVALNPQTGLVKTAEVRNAPSVVGSRGIALTGQSMGGK